jgi:glycine/D-amino acid oxidase-like deaminating enzyme
MRIVIVGAGIVGLSAAWWLKRQGHEPVVLDQGPIPNPHASSFDRHRLIRLAHGEGDGRSVIIHEAYAAWGELWRDLGRSHYRETGMLMTARDPDDFAVGARAQFDRLGTPYEILDRATLAGRFPYLLLGERDWGVFTAQGGALLAERIVGDLAQWLRRNGVVLREQARAVAVDGKAVVLEGGEQLAADRVVSAAGAWSGRILPSLDASLTPRRSVVLYLEPPDEVAEAWALSPCYLDLGGKSDLYIVPPMEGWGLKFGAGAHSGPASPDEPRALHADEPESLLNHLRPYVRNFDRYRVSDWRVCWTCYSPDERFICGVRPDGVVYATGCSGQMFKFGSIVGRRLAEAATGSLDATTLASWATGDRPLPLAA